jgi:hypothetical protein
MMMTKSTSGPSDQEWDESSVPVISERALARAHRTVRDFVRTYFPLHGVAPERVLDVWWLLVYVEGFVYQIDEENEAQCGPRRTTRPTTATTTTTLPPESTTGAVNLGDHRKPNPNFDPNADDADHRIDILTDRLQNSLERMNLSTWRGVLRSTTTTTSADAGAGAVTTPGVSLPQPAMAPTSPSPPPPPPPSPSLCTRYVARTIAEGRAFWKCERDLAGPMLAPDLEWNAWRWQAKRGTLALPEGPPSTATTTTTATTDAVATGMSWLPSPGKRPRPNDECTGYLPTEMENEDENECVAGSGPWWKKWVEDHGGLAAIRRGKAFDYRLLHHLLLIMVGVDLDLDLDLDQGHGQNLDGVDRVSMSTSVGDLLRFLEVDESLVDWGDDLVDYTDDVAHNAFNALRLLVRMHGPSAAEVAIADIQRLEEEHARLLARLPTPWQDAHLARRTQAEEEDGSRSLEWTVPSLILNETAYRANYGV